MNFNWGDNYLLVLSNRNKLLENCNIQDNDLIDDGSTHFLRGQLADYYVSFYT